MKLKPKVEEKTVAKEKIDPKAIRQDYLTKMERDLEEQGVVLFEPQTNLNIDGEFLSLPKAITDVPSRDLGEYLNAFTQQKMYLRTLLGRMSFVLEDSKREYYKASHKLYDDYSQKKLSETAKDRMINYADGVQDYFFKYTDTLRKIGILEQSIENIEDAIFLISREVTRRTGDFNDENRNHNVGRI